MPKTRSWVVLTCKRLWRQRSEDARDVICELTSPSKKRYESKQIVPSKPFINESASSEGAAMCFLDVGGCEKRYSAQLKGRELRSGSQVN